MHFKKIDIVCPRCKNELIESTTPLNQLICRNCKHAYPIIFGIPDLRLHSDPYIRVEDDIEKGLNLAGQFDKLNFLDLVEYYYQHTQVVPEKHAKQYMRSLQTAPWRAKNTLRTWQKRGTSPVDFSNKKLLEIGCGTGGLLINVVNHYQSVIGIDIAFRWLVVCKKRLDEAKIDIPLICACAEHLPFPDNYFDAVAGESTIEVVQDQAQVLREAKRVLRPGGSIMLSTPNRQSLGPDPHFGMWLGGYFPDRVVEWLVLKQGGIPPKRNLLSVRLLKEKLSQVGFEDIHISLPEISGHQRASYGRGMRGLIDIYTHVKKLNFTRQMLLQFGPMLICTAIYPDK